MDRLTGGRCVRVGGPGNAQEPSRPSHTVSGHPVPPQAGAGKRSGVGPVGDPGSSPSPRDQGFEDRGQPGSQVKPTCLYQREPTGPHSVSYASRLASARVAGSTLSSFRDHQRARAAVQGTRVHRGAGAHPQPSPGVRTLQVGQRRSSPFASRTAAPEGTAAVPGTPQGPAKPAVASQLPGLPRGGGRERPGYILGKPWPGPQKGPRSAPSALVPEECPECPAEARAGPEAGGQPASRDPPPPRLAGAF